MSNEPVVDQALTYEVAIYTIGVWGSSTLLMTSWLYLIFAEKNTLTMDLLEGNVCRWKIIVINSVLIECIHGRVRAGTSLVEGLLRHYTLSCLLLAILKVLAVVRADLKVGWDCAISTITIELVADWVPFACPTISY